MLIKTTNSSGISGKLVMIVMVAWTTMGLIFPANLSAQITEVKFGEYTFTTGSDQAKATSVLTGITMSDINNNVITTSFSGDLMQTTNWNNTVFGDGRKLWFSLSKSSEIAGFKITKLVITYKRNQSANKNLRIHYGSSSDELGVEFSRRNHKPTTMTLFEFPEGNALTVDVAVPCILSNDNTQFISIGINSDQALTSDLNPEIVEFDKIEVWGYVDFVLLETFQMYNLYSKVQPPAETNKIPDNLPLSLISGWATSSNIYAFNATEYKAAGNLANTETDSAYLTSPALKLDTPFEVEYNYRLRNQTINSVLHDPAIIKVYVDNQIIDLKENITSTVIANNKSTTSAFIAENSSKITFVSPMGFNADCIIDNIIVRYSTQPALNFALQSTKSLGTATKNSSKVFNLPLKAANLTGDVTLSLQSGANFTLSGGTTVTQANAEAGTDIAVTFNAPATVGTYTDVLTISAAGTTDRVVTLSAESDFGTGMDNLISGSVVINDNQLTINGHAGKRASIYNLSGAALFVLDNISDSQMFTLPSKGVYLLKLEGNMMMPVAIKVMIK